MGALFCHLFAFYSSHSLPNLTFIGMRALLYRLYEFFYPGFLSVLPFVSMRVFFCPFICFFSCCSLLSMEALFCLLYVFRSNLSLLNLKFILHKSSFPAPYMLIWLSNISIEFDSFFASYKSFSLFLPFVFYMHECSFPVPYMPFALYFFLLNLSYTCIGAIFAPFMSFGQLVLSFIHSYI